MLTRKIKLIVSISATLALLSLGFLVRERSLKDQIYQGVTIAGVDVGGLSAEQAKKKLEQDRPIIESLNMSFGSQHWTIDTPTIDLAYDLDGTVAEAFSWGRTGTIKSQWTDRLVARQKGKNVEMKFWVDENKLASAVASIAAQIDVPAKEPEIEWGATAAEVKVTPGEDGQEVDERLLKQKIKLAIRSAHANQNINEPLSIPVILLRPKLTNEQVEQVKVRAGRMVGKKLILSEPNTTQLWEIDDKQLLTWLDPQSRGWKRQEVDAWVQQLAQGVDRPAQNASFRFVEGGRVEEFRPGKDGFRIKQGDTAQAIMEALKILEEGKNETEIGLVGEAAAPEVTTEEVNNLGIKELVGKGESWFTGSITNRIFNLKKAADALNGVLIPPGEAFSFNKVVGDISAATGYRSAYIIKDGQTILGDGGGVCQVSSTIFRAALAAGLPIDERIAHAYRVSYYEVNYQPGFDATIFQPAPDFKFRNDTGHHILIQTVYDEKEKYLAFELYGTKDGREVTISKARTWDVIAPPPDLYIDDPNLPTGTVRQTEHKAWGAKVAFDWKVVKNSEVLQERTFYSNYRPWQAVYLRGTKVN